MLADIRAQYGNLGVYAVTQMNKLLTSYDSKLHIQYDSSQKKFTILESSSLTKRSLEEILLRGSYLGFRPLAVDQTDTLGNRIVILQHVEWIDEFDTDPNDPDLIEQNKACQVFEAYNKTST